LAIYQPILGYFLTFVDEMPFYYGLFFRIGARFGLIPSGNGDRIKKMLDKKMESIIYVECGV
jgi:hypothetical protein